MLIHQRLMGPRRPDHRRGFPVVFKLALVLGVIGPLTARADLPFADIVPADAMIVAGIGQTGDFWQKAHALPLARGIEQYLNSPMVTGDLDYQTFVIERKKMEEKLGFPVSIDEFLGQVFGSALVYAAGAVESTEPSLVAILGVKDNEKAGRLVEVIDEKNQEQSDLSAEAGGSSFEKIEIGGVAVSHLLNDGANDIYYALADDRLIFGLGRGAFEQALSGQPAADGGFASNPDAKTFTDKLPWTAADLVGYFDAGSLLQMGGGMPMGLPGLAQPNKVAMALSVASDGFDVQAVSDHNPAHENPNIQPSSLDGLFAINTSPIFAVDYGIFDAATAVANLRQVFNMLGAGMGGAPTLETFELQTGISIDDELVPALGNELIFAMNDLGMNPMGFGIPMVDMIFGAKVGDQAKMSSVLTKIEQMIEGQMGGMMGMGMTDPNDPNMPPPPKFTSTPHEGTEIRTLEVGMPGISPSHAIYNGYLLMSLNRESVLSAISRSTQSTSIGNSAIVGELSEALAGKPPYSLSILDMSRVAEAVSSFIPMLANPDAGVSAEQLTQIVSLIVARIGTVAQVDTGEGELMRTLMRVKMTDGP